MNIFWRGQSFFEITIKDRENGDVRIAIDPFDAKKIGLHMPKVEADVLLITHAHSDHSNIKAIQGKPFVISELGEYEIKDVFVKGISVFHDNKEGGERGEVIIYIIEAEGIRLCHLSDLGQKELTPEQLEEIGEVDILMVPVGGTYTVDAKGAAEIISQIEPRVVIPMHYKIPNLKIPLDGVDKFLKIMGAESAGKDKRLKITKANLPAEETRVVVLEP